MVYEGIIMSTLFGAIGDSINQDKGMVYGLVNNAISYAQSRKAQKRAFEYARGLQQHQYDLTQQGYRESPTNQRLGMESAGYNPMLALGNVGSSASIAGGTPVSANATDSADLAGNAATLQSMQNQTEQTKATVENLDSSTAKNQSETLANTIKNKYLDDREKAEIGQIEAGSSKMQAEIRNLTFMQQLAEKQLEMQRYGIDMNYMSSIYNSNSTSSAMRYGADKSYNASTYAADKAASSSFGHTAATLGLGLMGMYGLGKISPRNIKKVGQLIKVAPKFIRLP